MPQKTPAYEQALIFLEILKILPRHRKITQTEIMQSLNLRGYQLETQKLQRIMRQMCDCEAFGVECDQRSKPYGYRLINQDAFAQAKLTEEESLLLLLVRAHLQHRLPGMRILICVNGGLKHVNTPDSYLRERCAKRAASVLSVA